MQFNCRDANSADYDAVLAINRDALDGLSELEIGYFSRLIRLSERFRVIEVDGNVAGYLFALMRDAAYDEEEFNWFREHLGGEFLYIDQVAIAKPFQGMGLGQALYRDLEEYAGAAGTKLLACEVYFQPFNNASQTFHKQFGFKRKGQMKTRGKMVSLLVKKLSPD